MVGAGYKDLKHQGNMFSLGFIVWALPDIIEFCWRHFMLKKFLTHESDEFSTFLFNDRQSWIEYHINHVFYCLNSAALPCWARGTAPVRGNRVLGLGNHLPLCVLPNENQPIPHLQPPPSPGFSHPWAKLLLPNHPRTNSRLPGTAPRPQSSLK